MRDLEMVKCVAFRLNIKENPKKGVIVTILDTEAN